MVQDLFCVEDDEIIKVEKYSTTFKWEDTILIASWAYKVNTIIVTDINKVIILRAIKIYNNYEILEDRRDNLQ